MPWRGLEPRRLSAPPPQDGVSTNFTTRANPFCIATEPTGLEPATSRVTVECSNQTELRLLLAALAGAPLALLAPSLFEVARALRSLLLSLPCQLTPQA